MSTTTRKILSAPSGRLGSAAAATSVLSAFIASACFKAVEVAVEEGRAEVSYDPSRTTPEALAAAVTTLGYASKPIASKEL